MAPEQPTRTIDQVLEEFLREQEARLSQSTFSRYEDIIHLLRSCLEGYWPGHDQKEYDRITKAGGTFCGTFGTQLIWTKKGDGREKGSELFSGGIAC